MVIRTYVIRTYCGSQCKLFLIPAVCAYVCTYVCMYICLHVLYVHIYTYTVCTNVYCVRSKEQMVDGQVT